MELGGRGEEIRYSFCSIIAVPSSLAPHGSCSSRGQDCRASARGHERRHFDELLTIGWVPTWWAGCRGSRGAPRLEGYVDSLPSSCGHTCTASPAKYGLCFCDETPSPLHWQYPGDIQARHVCVPGGPPRPCALRSLPRRRTD